MTHASSPLIRFFQDRLALRIGLLVALTEVIVLSSMGTLYVQRFNRQVDLRLTEKVSSPGILMAEGLLEYAVAADETLMTQMIGEGYVDSMVVAHTGRILVAKNALYQGRQIHQIEGLDTHWFDTFGKSKEAHTLRGESGPLLTHITPVQSTTGAYLVWVKVDTTSSNEEKVRTLQLVLFGSLICILLTAITIIASINFLISRRLQQTLDTVKRVEYGDGVARVEGAEGTDSIGVLQRGLNDMIVRSHKRTSERTQLQNQLQRAQKMEAMGRLAGGIAHDFNNLLTGIIGNISLALDDTEDEEQRDALQEAQNAAERASELTKQLLTLSRKRPPMKKPTQLNNLIQQVSHFLERAIGSTIQIETTTNPAIPTVHVDEGQLHQALLNLGINARDAMPKGGDLIYKSDLEEVENLPGYEGVTGVDRFVRITVKDTGVGMDPETVDRIFEPFFTTKEPGAGTGLGLAMVYSCAQAHDGWVEVESCPGEGTAFHLFLPVIEGVEHVQTIRKPLPRGTGTILVVDDTNSVLMLSRIILSKCGYRVIIAWDGAEALEKVATHGKIISLIITDLVMPRFGGRELFQRLRNQGSTIPVIATSGFTHKGRVEGLLAEGFAAFVPKPFNAQGLARVVQETLDEHKQEPQPMPYKST